VALLTAFLAFLAAVVCVFAASAAEVAGLGAGGEGAGGFHIRKWALSADGWSGWWSKGLRQKLYGVPLSRAMSWVGESQIWKLDVTY